MSLDTDDKGGKLGIGDDVLVEKYYTDGKNLSLITSSPYYLPTRPKQ